MLGSTSLFNHHPSALQTQWGGHFEVPPNAGKIISTEWDFLGAGDFVDVPFGPVMEAVEAQVTFAYLEPGSYTLALRVTSQREGNASSQYRRVAVDVL